MRGRVVGVTKKRSEHTGRRYVAYRVLGDDDKVYYGNVLGQESTFTEGQEVRFSTHAGNPSSALDLTAVERTDWHAKYASLRDRLQAVLDDG